MKATGIVRRIDDLGRVVVPKEIRRTLHLGEGEPMEIFTGKDGEIILKKYSPLGEMGNSAGKMAECIAGITGCLTCVTDMDQVIAAAGKGSKNYQGQAISQALTTCIRNRENTPLRKEQKDRIPILDQEEGENPVQIICPVLCEGDAMGAVVLLASGTETKMGELEAKIAAVAAAFLGKQLETC